MFGSGWIRGARAAAAFVVASGAVVIVGAASAHAAGAAGIAPHCTPYLTDANGDPTSPAPGGDVDLPPLNLGSLGSGTVPTGTVIPITVAGTTTKLPATTNTALGTATIDEVKNITLHFTVSGAAALSQPTLSGGNVLGATATTTSTGLTLTLPGSKTGSTVPKGNAFFPGGGTLSNPSMKMKVTAPDTPGTITTSLATIKLLVKITVSGLDLVIFLDCTAPKNTLGSVNVVTPGAPVAVDDSASTNAGQPVTIDVLANDKPNDKNQPPDPTTLSITSNPKHGSAVVTSDHKVTYTPSAGFSGTDTFVYQVCDVVETPTTTTSTTTTTIEQPQAHRSATRRAAPKATADSELKCDPATVTVTVGAPVTTEGSVQTTTVAPASELPRTGSTSTPMALVGGGLCVLGLAALGATRRRVRD